MQACRVRNEAHLLLAAGSAIFRKAGFYKKNDNKYAEFYMWTRLKSFGLWVYVRAMIMMLIVIGIITIFDYSCLDIDVN